MKDATPSHEKPPAPSALHAAAENAQACDVQGEIARYKRNQERLESLLNAARTEYRSTFELAAVGIAHVAPDGTFLRVNPYICRMLGYAADEMLGKSFQDVTYPDDLAGDREKLNAVLAGELNSYVLEKRYIRKDGSTVWGHLTVSLVRDQYGRPVYFIAVVKDIDERRRAVDALARSRARLKAVLETLSEGVLVFDAGGHVLEANSVAMALFGYQRQEEISGSLEDLDKTFDVFDPEGKRVPPADWPVRHLLRGEPVNGVELLVQRKGTQRRWTGRFSGWMVRVDHNDSPLAVLTVTDVTYQRQAEAAVRIGKERLRLAFDSIPDPMIIYDGNMRVRAANEALLRETGLRKEDLIGRRDHESCSLFLASVRPTLERAFRSGVAQSDDVAFSDGEALRNLMVTCVPLPGPAGSQHEVMVVCHEYTERRKAEESARHAALHDPLTGLPNRALLFEYARHLFAGARRAGETVAVAFIDLDRFKPINDMHGHAVGDAVLREVSSRLQRCVRGEDIVFRLGGDEFLILLPGLDPRQEPEAVARHILDALQAPCRVGVLEIGLSASIGISLFPLHASDIDALVSHADAAMYEAKLRGRNQVQSYTPEVAEKVRSHVQIEGVLKQALRENGLCLHYQPVVDIHTGRLVSVEALVRFADGAWPPDRFVPIAESSGLIAELGEWVLAEVCRQLAKWRREGMPPVPIAINVSALQFRNNVFMESLFAAIKAGRVPAGEIQIELTETAVMEDLRVAVGMLQRLRGEGVKVALDDFGTGYSSLNYLSQLPLDKIKVDKTFIHRLFTDEASRAVTDSIIALGRALNLEIVAEGIECREELAYLRELGCDQAQGYYLCRPISGDEFSAWYRRHGQA
ncbi:sensor domain-containing protein [Noviherbaspirillum aridicola]|uniref:PAS domain S-box-containing protein/diguanylate cyclase (GGDEF)-like protein n=1 Tax=Noviherbaspirillum aridicola TaxID=2849687 RepID=A0ABQ4PZL0_9BURK|nr:EAL domain-containing protein [Noviherbaspirillum aridicola]GIZ50263.1 hypothetical protein NCCP691_02770 [Noviherbaspirillum aridicola]